MLLNLKAKTLHFFTKYKASVKMLRRASVANFCSVAFVKNGRRIKNSMAVDKIGILSSKMARASDVCVLLFENLQREKLILFRCRKLVLSAIIREFFFIPKQLIFMYDSVVLSTK